jgi:hypothetical protein
MVVARMRVSGSLWRSLAVSGVSDMVSLQFLMTAFLTVLRFLNSFHQIYLLHVPGVVDVANLTECELNLGQKKKLRVH